MREDFISVGGKYVTASMHTLVSAALVLYERLAWQIEMYRDRLKYWYVVW